MNLLIFIYNLQLGKISNFTFFKGKTSKFFFNFYLYPGQNFLDFTYYARGGYTCIPDLHWELPPRSGGTL